MEPVSESGAAWPPRESAWRLPHLGWMLVLALFPVVAFWFLPSLRRTSGSTDPQITAVYWASLAVALRAVVALVRGSRSRWWIIYVLVYPGLLLVAGLVAEWRDFSVLWR